MARTVFSDITYVSDGKIRRADIVVDGEYISKISDKEELSSPFLELLLPGIIDEHVHTREPGLTHKGDLDSETHAAAAGGVTTILDMPNVKPQTTDFATLDERFRLGAQHAFVNYSFYFGATNTNAHLLRDIDTSMVPAVKLFMGSSTGGMLVDGGEALRDVFELSPLPIMAHCEDSSVINANMQRAQSLYGEDPDVVHHPEIRSREACLASSRLAARLAHETGARLHIAHITTAEELDLAADNITLEACVPHLLFTDADYARLGTRIKCNPAVKTEADRAALRSALSDGRITAVATDHAPHLLSEKQGGCLKAMSGMPMVQFSLPAMLGLVDAGVLTITRLVELMCHAPSRLFDISNRGFIREGMKADFVLVRRHSWTLDSSMIVSRCGWSPLEGHTFGWQVAQTFCNGHLIYNDGLFADGNQHAQAVTFSR